MNIYTYPNSSKYVGLYSYFNRAAITTGEGATITRSDNFVSMTFPIDVKPNTYKVSSATIEITGTGLKTSTPISTKVLVKFTLDDGSTALGWSFDGLSLSWPTDSVNQFFDFVSLKQYGLDYFENMLMGTSPTTNNIIDFSNQGGTLTGGMGNDTIYGGIGADRLNGLGGDNTLYGNDGDDVLMALYGGTNRFFGGNGDDTIYAGDGEETYSGGDGYDTLILSNINWGSTNLSVFSVSNDTKIKFIEGAHSVTINRDSDIEVFQFKNGISKSLSQLISTYPIGKLPTYNAPPVITNESHTLSVIVDRGVLGKDPVLLKGLTERVTLSNGVPTSKTIEYAGNIFDYSKIDSLIITVTRDGDFTTEFRKELTDAAPSTINLTYKDAVTLVGLTNIDSVLINLAGLDGNFVN